MLNKESKLCRHSNVLLLVIVLTISNVRIEITLISPDPFPRRGWSLGTIYCDYWHSKRVTFSTHSTQSIGTLDTLFSLYSVHV